MPDLENEGVRKPEVFVKNITFNDGSTIDFNRSDIVVFTGANNAGKSQMLKEILQYFQVGDKNLSKIITHLEGEFLGDIDYYLSNTKRDANGNYWTGELFQDKDLIEMWWQKKH